MIYVYVMFFMFSETEHTCDMDVAVPPILAIIDGDTGVYSYHCDSNYSLPCNFVVFANV